MTQTTRGNSEIHELEGDEGIASRLEQSHGTVL